jgi:ABC-type microcin C transport system permease subunit YejB
MPSARAGITSAAAVALPATGSKCSRTASTVTSSDPSTKDGSEDSKAAAVAAPYTRFSLMRGVGRWRTLLRVAARPALAPVLAYAPVLAMQFLEGFVAIELVFNLDGIGLLLVRSLEARDIPVVMTAGILLALILAAVTAATDLALSLVDPRHSSEIFTAQPA